MVRVMLADRQQMVREALSQSLGGCGDMKVVADVGEGLAALEAAKRLRPDVVLLSLNLRDVPAFDVLRQLTAAHLRVVVLTNHESSFFLREAWRLGAAAYLLKVSPLDELITAIRSAAAGGKYVSAAAAAQLDSLFDENLRYLTPREYEVLRLAAEGLEVKQVAARLRIGVRTAEMHRYRLMHKLHLANQTDLVRFALAHGITDLEPSLSHPLRTLRAS